MLITVRSTQDMTNIQTATVPKGALMLNPILNALPFSYRPPAQLFQPGIEAANFRRTIELDTPEHSNAELLSFRNPCLLILLAIAVLPIRATASAGVRYQLWKQPEDSPMQLFRPQAKSRF